MITTILFDLDGTLLPMDMDTFVRAYFGGLAKFAAPHGYEEKSLIKTVWAGTLAMIRNDGHRTNEEVFWDVFSYVYGDRALQDAPIFNAFYEKDFNLIQSVCGYDPAVPSLLCSLKRRGVPLFLATNPVFPRVATARRIRWAGLSPDDFLLYTTYENARHCKPNLDYYRDIMSTLRLVPEECIMVGNDVDEDMVAKQLGMKVFLVTNCLINRHDADISLYPHGDIQALRDYLNTVS